MQIKQGQQYNSSSHKPPKCSMNQTYRQISLIHFLFTTTFLSNIVTARKRSLRRTMFLLASVILSTGGVSVLGVSLTEAPWTDPLDRGPTRTETHQDRDPPGQWPTRTETPQDRDPPGQRPWTETPWTETPIDRDPMDRDPHGQRSPWTETLWTEILLDRDPHARRSPWTETPPIRWRMRGTHPTGMHSCLLLGPDICDPLDSN